MHMRPCIKNRNRPEVAKENPVILLAAFSIFQYHLNTQLPLAPSRLLCKLVKSNQFGSFNRRPVLGSRPGEPEHKDAWRWNERSVTHRDGCGPLKKKVK